MCQSGELRIGERGAPSDRTPVSGPECMLEAIIAAACIAPCPAMEFLSALNPQASGNVSFPLKVVVVNENLHHQPREHDHTAGNDQTGRARHLPRTTKTVNGEQR
jgi:hypothetical protein